MTSTGRPGVGIGVGMEVGGGWGEGGGTSWPGEVISPSQVGQPQV